MMINRHIIQKSNFVSEKSRKIRRFIIIVSILLGTHLQNARRNPPLTYYLVYIHSHSTDSISHKSARKYFKVKRIRIGPNVTYNKYLL